MSERGKVKRALLIGLCLLGTLMFSALGVWQVERRAWKIDLIARVNARVHAPAVPVPPRSTWASFDPRTTEYRHVQVAGILRNDKETLVDALTERGAGSWVMTPLETGEGTILVNRGFVPPERRARRTRRAAEPSGKVAITGLVRVTEPGGRFLRKNEPAKDRWFSRDVSAIAHKRGLAGVAPFFIDADASPNSRGYPVGGLTVVHFRNAHLIYAITWFGLALLALAGLVLLLLPPHMRARWMHHSSH